MPALCARLGALLGEGGVDLVIFEVGRVDVDAVTLDALARLRLVARRQDCSVVLRCASSELLDLIALAGLAGLFPGEPRRQAEQRE